MPDRQTLFTVEAGTVIGMPPLTAAWRAVICPAPGLDHLTHDHVVDLVTDQPRTLERRRDGQPTQVHAGEPDECP